MDVRTVISAHAQILRTFCANTQHGISFVLLKVDSTSLISAEALPQRSVETQVNIQTDIVRSAGNWELQVLIIFLQLLIASSHLITGFGTNAFFYIPSINSTSASVGINSYQLNNHSAPCYCLSISNCPVPGALYPTQQTPTFGQYNLETFGNTSIPVKGIQVGCSALDSALGSTLECYYDPDCIQLLVKDSERFTPLQTISDDLTAEKKTIQTLLNEVFVTNWLVNTSYANYYHECAPKTCSYSFNQRNDFLIIFTILIAVIGGLNTVLRMLAPWIIQLLVHIIQEATSRNNHVSRVAVVWIEQSSFKGNNIPIVIVQKIREVFA